MKLGIIGAMDVEVAALKQSMLDKRERTIAGTVYCEGVLENLPVVVVQCGVGKVNAALCVQALCDHFSVTHLVNTGVAGSLDAKLDIGDFIPPELYEVVAEILIFVDSMDKLKSKVYK